MLRLIFAAMLAAAPGSAGAATIRTFDYTGPAFSVTDGPERVTGSITFDAEQALATDDWLSIQPGWGLIEASFSGLSFDLARDNFEVRVTFDGEISDWRIGRGDEAHGISFWGCRKWTCEADPQGQAYEWAGDPDTFLRYAEGAGTWTERGAAPSPAPVPLPAAAWLLLGGAGALGLLRWRRA